MLLHLFHLQKVKVLSELFMYVDNNQEQAISNGTKATLSYLEACNKICEGFLSHKKITNMDSVVLKSINEGLQVFHVMAQSDFR